MAQDPLTISEFDIFISENGACPRVEGEGSRRKAASPHPRLVPQRSQEAGRGHASASTSLTCYHLPVKWQTPWRIFRSLSFSQTPFPTQNSILAQPGSRVSAKLVGMFTPQSLCVSQFLEMPHKWIKIAAPVCASSCLPLCLPERLLRLALGICRSLVTPWSHSTAISLEGLLCASVGLSARDSLDPPHSARVRDL